MDSKHSSVNAFYVVLGLALVVAMSLAVWLIGASMLASLALIFVIGLTLALVIGASALPIRAWKRRDMTGETHHFHDGTKTIIRETRVIDGRTVEAPKLYQLPAAPQGQFFPELLRASYQAGMLARPGAAESVDAEVRELTEDVNSGWDGEINL